MYTHWDAMGVLLHDCHLTVLGRQQHNIKNGIEENQIKVRKSCANYTRKSIIIYFGFDRHMCIPCRGWNTCLSVRAHLYFLIVVGQVECLVDFP